MKRITPLLMAITLLITCSCGQSQSQAENSSEQIITVNNKEYANDKLEVLNLLDRPKEEINAVTSDYGVLKDTEDSDKYILQLDDNFDFEELWSIANKLCLSELVLVHPVLIKAAMNYQ